MGTAFDVRGLTAKQIGQLLADGHDLRRFKNALVTIVAGLPAITDQDEHRKRLEAAAADVLKEWKKYKKSLPRFALDALVETAELEWPKIVSTGGLLAVEETRWVGTGVGVALLAHKGVKVLGDYREHRNGPYRYEEAVWDQKLETFLRLHERAFRDLAACRASCATTI
jgi:hypothetical protein